MLHCVWDSQSTGVAFEMDFSYQAEKIDKAARQCGLTTVFEIQWFLENLILMLEKKHIR